MQKSIQDSCSNKRIALSVNQQIPVNKLMLAEKSELKNGGRNLFLAPPSGAHAQVQVFA